MKLEIQVDDDVFKAYQREAGRRKISPAALMAEQLARFQSYSTVDRVVVVGPEARERLEQIFARQLQDDKALVGLVERLAELRIGSVRVEATPAQLEELKRLADKEKRPFKEVAEERYAQVARGYFNAW